MTLLLDSNELITRLAADVDTALAKALLVVFDADGTLWSGDVGNDVFAFAAEQNLFRDPLRARLIEEAVLHQLPLDLELPTSQLALEFVRACTSGMYPEVALCALQTWCYAGLREVEVHELARQAVGSKLSARYQPEVLRVLGWARSFDLRCVVVSASPRQVLEPLCAELGFAPADIVAAEPNLGEDGRIAARLTERVPYAEDKIRRAKQQLGARPWLAALGDSGFDAPMLSHARHGVAVRPKESLLARLPDMHNVVRLVEM